MIIRQVKWYSWTWEVVSFYKEKISEIHALERARATFSSPKHCFHGDPYGLVAKLTDWLAVAQIPCLTDKLNWLTDSPADWVTDWLTLFVIAMVALIYHELRKLKEDNVP